MTARVKYSGVAERVPDIERLAAFWQHGRTGEELTDESLKKFVGEAPRDQDDGVTGAAWTPTTEQGRRDQQEEKKPEGSNEAAAAAPGTTTTPGGLIL